MEHKSCPRCGAAFICQLKKPVTKILYKANAPLRARLFCRLTALKLSAIYSPPPVIKPAPFFMSALAQSTVSGCTSIAEVIGC